MFLIIFNAFFYKMERQRTDAYNRFATSSVIEDITSIMFNLIFIPMENNLSDRVTSIYVGEQDCSILKATFFLLTRYINEQQKLVDRYSNSIDLSINRRNLKVLRTSRKSICKALKLFESDLETLKSEL